MKTKLLALAALATALGTISASAQVITTNPPTITAPPEIVAECCCAGRAVVEVTATVEDIDGEAVTVVWFINDMPYETNDIPAGVPITSATLSITNRFLVGTNEVKIVAADGMTDPVESITLVIVEDTTDPVIQRVVVRPQVLWPPNHKMRLVRVRPQIEDCTRTRWQIRRVVSDEPADDRGDGKFAPDIVIARDRQSVYLRAERMGGGDGRVYTILIEAVDQAGNSTLARTRVFVPHDMGKGKEEKRKK